MKNKHKIGIAVGIISAYLGYIFAVDQIEGPERFLGIERIDLLDRLEGTDLENQMGIVEFFRKGDRTISNVYIIRKNGQHLLDCDYDDECLFVGRQSDHNSDGEIDWGLPGNAYFLNIREEIYPLVEEYLPKYIDRKIN